MVLYILVVYFLLSFLFLSLSFCIRMLHYFSTIKLPSYVTLWRSIGHLCVHLFFSSLFYSSYLSFILMPITHCPVNCNFRICFEFYNVDPPALFFIKVVLFIPGLLYFPMNFRNSLLILTKCLLAFEYDCGESMNQCEEN